MATKRGPKTGKLSNLKSSTSKKIDAGQVRGGRAGKGQNEYLVFKMADVIVTSVQPGGSGGGDGSSA